MQKQRISSTVSVAASVIVVVVVVALTVNLHAGADFVVDVVVCILWPPARTIADVATGHLS